MCSAAKHVEGLPGDLPDYLLAKNGVQATVDLHFTGLATQRQFADEVADGVWTRKPGLGFDGLPLRRADIGRHARHVRHQLPDRHGLLFVGSEFRKILADGIVEGNAALLDKNHEARTGGDRLGHGGHVEDGVDRHKDWFGLDLFQPVGLLPGFVPGVRSASDGDHGAGDVAGLHCLGHDGVEGLFEAGHAAVEWHRTDVDVSFPLVEVEVMAVDLDFAALEIVWLAAEAVFGRGQLATVIEIDNHPVGIEVSAEELLDAYIVMLLQAVGGVGRQPSPGFDVELGPVVHVDAIGFRLPTGLPTGRDACCTAQGDEGHSLDTAVALPGGESFGGQIRDRAVFHFRAPADVVRDPAEDPFGLFQRVLFTADDFRCELLHSRRELDMWEAFGCVLLVQLATLVVGLHLVWIEVGDVGGGDEFELGREGWWPGGVIDRFFEVDRPLRVPLGGNHGFLRFGCEKLDSALLPVFLREWQPAPHPRPFL